MAASKQNWSVADTTFLLEILKELRIVERLDGRKVRNNELFKQVFDKMKEAGIHRTTDQIKNRWKSLKAAYYKAKSQNGKSGSDPASFPFYGLMDDLMGERPLANMTCYGVDVGLEDEAPVPQEDSSITDDEDSSIEETDNSSTQQISTETEDSCPHTSKEPRTAKKKSRPTSSSYAKAMRSWSTEQQSFLEKLQESQNMWIEEQQEKHQQREERLLSRFMEESSRSNERLLGQLFNGLKAIFPQTPPHPQDRAPAFPYPPQTSQHPHPGYSSSAHYSQNNSNYSENYNSDYNLHDLG